MKLKNLKSFLIVLFFLAAILTGLSSYVSVYPVLKPVDRPLPRFPDGGLTYKNVLAFRGTLESQFNNVRGKTNYIQLNGLAQRLMSRRVVDDADPSLRVVRLDNGYLTFLEQPRNVVAPAEQIAALRDHLQEQGINLLYVQRPAKICKYDPQLPTGVEDHTNENMDNLLDSLRAEGIDCIDLRDAMWEELDYYNAFFKTDHHWKPEAGLWAFGAVGRYLNENCAFDIDESLFDPDNYDVEIKEAWFLGSQGKRVGTAYAGVDDISLLTPKFDTALECSTPHKNEHKSGDFREVMFALQHINKRDYFVLNPYAVYTGGDFPLQSFTNHLDEGGKKVLLVRDSFCCTFSPFFALGCAQLDNLDLRHYQGSVKDYADETNPDIVIIMTHTALSGKGTIL